MAPAKPKQASPLVAAAEAFDESLRRFSALSETLRRGALESRANLERAGEVLKEVATSEEELQAHARALVAALGTARDAQQSEAEQVQARAQEIQARTEIYAGIRARFEEMGNDAAGLNTLAQALASRRGIADQSLRDSELPALLSELDELRERMTGVAEAAAQLEADARGARFEDLARNGDSLRQQLLSARNRIGLLREALVAAVPAKLIS